MHCIKTTIFDAILLYFNESYAKMRFYIIEAWLDFGDRTR